MAPPGGAPAPAYDLVVLGELNPDVLVVDPDPVPVFGQVERLVDRIRLTIGSSSAIAACGAARLGLRTAMVGVTGDDALGRYLLEALSQRGVDVSWCRVAAGRPTGASVILGTGTDRAILTAPGTIADARARDVPPGLLARARHLHVGSVFLQPALAAELPSLFAAARAGGVTTSLDPNWDPSGRWDGGFAEAAAAADVILPNAAEAERLTGIADPGEAARALASAGGPRDDDGPLVVVKLGPDGALAARRDGRVIRQPAPPITPVDTTGAGDSFDAGFLWAFLDGRPIAECLRAAVACGALSTRDVGGTEAQATAAEAGSLAATLPAATVADGAARR